MNEGKPKRKWPIKKKLFVALLVVALTYPLWRFYAGSAIFGLYQSYSKNKYAACVPPYKATTPKGKIDHASAIFIGKVSTITHLESITSTISSEESGGRALLKGYEYDRHIYEVERLSKDIRGIYTISFEIEHVWKDANAHIADNKLLLSYPTLRAREVYPFESGKTYLIFAYSDGALQTSDQFKESYCKWQRNFHPLNGARCLTVSEQNKLIEPINEAEAEIKMLNGLNKETFKKKPEYPNCLDILKQNQNSWLGRLLRPLSPPDV